MVLHHYYLNINIIYLILCNLHKMQTYILYLIISGYYFNNFQKFQYYRKPHTVNISHRILLLCANKRMCGSLQSNPLHISLSLLFLLAVSFQGIFVFFFFKSIFFFFFGYFSFFFWSRNQFFSLFEMNRSE